MMSRMRTALLRADCALVGAIAIVAVSGASAREFVLYTDEMRALASLPDSVSITSSPVALAQMETAQQAECLAEVMYYEARGEGIEGEKAVAEVVLQRTHERDYPSTVCGVAYDGIQPDRRDCQFSFACDASLRRPREGHAWQRVRQLAEKILIGAVQLPGRTGHAVAYHNVDDVFYRRDPMAQARQQQGGDQAGLTNISVPTSVIKPGMLLGSEEIQPQIQTAGAMGDGA